jgi:hypothetical protein
LADLIHVVLSSDDVPTCSTTGEKNIKEADKLSRHGKDAWSNF